MSHPGYETIPIDGEDPIPVPDVEKTKRTRVIIVSLVTFSLVVAAVFVLALVRPPYKHAYGVASSNRYATNLGYDILSRGGNVVDAIVAIQAMLTLTEPMSSGLGGGCMIVIRMNDANGTVIAIDGREEAPNLSTNVLPNRVGGAASGVPGTVHAMMSALEKYGTFHPKLLFAPVIERAKEGWTLDEWSHSQIENQKQTLAKFPASAALFLDKNMEPLPVGTTMINKKYAEMLETMIEKGWRTFYNGTIGEHIVNAIRGDTVQPGNMSLQDLAEYRAVHREPLKTTWKDYTMYGMPMPSSGLATLTMALNMLEEVAPEKEVCGQNADSIALALNALSVAFADRDEWMADADWEDVPLEGLMEKAYIKARAALVNTTKAADGTSAGFPPGAPAEHYGTSDDRESHHTTHFSIVDPYGNVAVITSTIEWVFGNGMVVPELGIFLNNELTDFSAKGRNQISGGRKLRKTALEPDNNSYGGKRPRSSMTPTIIMKNDQPHLLVGSPGGTSIIGVVMDVVLGVLECNKTLTEAVNAPRYVSKNSGSWLFEKALFDNKEIVEALRNIGANPVESFGHSVGAVAAIKFAPEGKLDAVADKRKDGFARVSAGTAYP